MIAVTPKIKFMDDNALTQYLDLYRRHRQTVCGNAPEALNARRADALRALEGARLPRKSTNGNPITDLNAMFAPDYGVNINRLPFTADPAAFRCGVPNVSALTGIMANDMFIPGAAMRNRLPEGVTVCTFTEAAKCCPDVLREHYGTVAPLDKATVALNTLLAQDGVLVHVARGVSLSAPLQIIAQLGGVTTPMLALRRLLIVLDEGAQCKILLCDHGLAAGTDAGAIPMASDSVVEAVLGADAHLEIYDMQESADNTARYAYYGIRQHARSVLRGNLTTLRCGTTRNDIDVDLCGDGAECLLSGMVIAADNQVADNTTVVTHTAPHCHSDQLFKYVVADSARCVFDGLIKVQPGAHHTEAYQNNRNILADAQARMHTRPQLEIYCDDVRANHGSATGQLDREALFYMRTRGIPRDTARTMLMQAFMTDVIDTISLLPLRDRMRQLVARRLDDPADVAAACAACQPKKSTNA